MHNFLKVLNKISNKHLQWFDNEKRFLSTSHPLVICTSNVICSFYVNILSYSFPVLTLYQISLIKHSQPLGLACVLPETSRVTCLHH